MALPVDKGKWILQLVMLEDRVVSVIVWKVFRWHHQGFKRKKYTNIIKAKQTDSICYTVTRRPRAHTSRASQDSTRQWRRTNWSLEAHPRVPRPSARRTLFQPALFFITTVDDIHSFFFACTDCCRVRTSTKESLFHF